MDKVHSLQKSHRYADRVQASRQAAKAAEWDGYTVGAGLKLTYGYL